MGCLGAFFPSRAASLTNILPVGAMGISEIRATYGGSSTRSARPASLHGRRLPCECLLDLDRDTGLVFPVRDRVDRAQCSVK